MEEQTSNSMHHVSKLLDAKSIADARRVALETGAQDGPAFLRLARSIVATRRSLAEAAKFFMFAWHMKRGSFNFEDMITFCKCITDSDVARGDMPIIRSIFTRRLEASDLPEAKRTELKVRFFGAANDFMEADRQLDRFSFVDGSFKPSRACVKDFAYALLWTGRYDALDALLAEFGSGLDTNDVKDFDFASRTYRAAKVQVLTDEFGYRSILFQTQAPKGLVVTFGYSGTGKRSFPYAASFLIKEGFDVLHFAQAEGSGYQYLDEAVVRDLVDRTREARVYQQTFTYGSSLGGYAALYYAGAADAVAIAGSPRHILHPSFRTTKYPIFDERHVSMANVMKTEKVAHILNDPLEAMDARGMDTMFRPNIPNAVIHDFPGYGHPVTTKMAKNRELKPIILSILNEE